MSHDSHREVRPVSCSAQAETRAHETRTYTHATADADARQNNLPVARALRLRPVGPVRRSLAPRPISRCPLRPLTRPGSGAQNRKTRWPRREGFCPPRRLTGAGGPLGAGAHCSTSYPVDFAGCKGAAEEIRAAGLANCSAGSKRTRLCISVSTPFLQECH